MVKKSFLKCGISNAMDGSEDNLLYEDENETAAENETDDKADDDDDDEYTADVEVTKEQYDELFDDSDDNESEFEGF